MQWPRKRTGSGESDSASNLLQSWRMRRMPISAHEKVKITGFKTLTIPPNGLNAGWFAPFSFHWNDNSVMQRDYIKLRLQESTREMKSCDASETKREAQAKAEEPPTDCRDDKARSKPGSSKVCFITERFHPFSPSLFLLSYFSVYSISWSLVTSFWSVLIHQGHPTTVFWEMIWNGSLCIL